MTDVNPMASPTIQPATSWLTRTAPRSVAIAMIPPVAMTRTKPRSITLRRRSRPGNMPCGRSLRPGAWDTVSGGSSCATGAGRSSGAAPSPGSSDISTRIPRGGAAPNTPHLVKAMRLPEPAVSRERRVGAVGKVETAGSSLPTAHLRKADAGHGATRIRTADLLDSARQGRSRSLDRLVTGSAE